MKRPICEHCGTTECKKVYPFKDWPHFLWLCSSQECLNKARDIIGQRSKVCATCKIRPRRADNQRVCKLCHAEAQKRVRDAAKQEFQRLRDENLRLRQECDRLRELAHV